MTVATGRRHNRCAFEEPGTRASGTHTERDGTLTALTHEVVETTARVKEFAEQTAVASRMMYAVPNRRTSHRLAALDVPTISSPRISRPTTSVPTPMSRIIDAIWLDEVDEHANPMGSRGAGEIGIVGAPAAVANAIHHATGVRVRSLPITPDSVST